MVNYMLNFVVVEREMNIVSKFEERTIHRKTIFEGRIIDLYLDEVSLPNGKTSSREIIKHPGAVAVIAITEEEKILLVEQYRKALERTLIEIPAGKLEKGEDPRESAKRELIDRKSVV